MNLRPTWLRSLDEVPPEEWDALDTGGNPFLRHAFLAAAERHGAVAPALGWHPHHLVLRDDAGRLAGALPLYRRTHSFGDFSSDWNWASAFESLGVRYYPKLVTGVPYTPAGGARLLVAAGAERGGVMDALVSAVLGEAGNLSVSSWQCLFMERADEVEALEKHGFLLRHGCQFHWHNQGYADFEAFLATFSAEKRKKVRRERRRVAESGLTVDVRHGSDIDPALWDRLYPFYVSTFERFGNYPAFSQGFFEEVGGALGKGLVAFIAREDGRPVASAICYRDGDALYGRHWGAEADYHSLHFELCFYQGVEYCIREGLSRFEPGAQGEHKVSRGFSPRVTQSAIWIAQPRVRQVIARFLQREREAMAAYSAEMRMHEPYKHVEASRPVEAPLPVNADSRG